MIYFFLGKDFNIVNKRVEELINKLDISNIIKYDFSVSSLEEIINEVNYIDLFNEKKLIIVSSFVLKSLSKEDESLLTKYINNMNDNVIIFKCDDDSFDERRSITKLIRSKCKVIEILKLDYKSLHGYVSNMFKENNINASFNQIKRILDICEYNPDYTISEVEKLLIYKIGETELYDKDIDDVISKNNEKEIFNFIENLFKKDIKESLNSYKILISSNIDPLNIIDSIAKQYRLLLQLKDLYHNNDEELARKLGFNSLRGFSRLEEIDMPGGIESMDYGAFDFTNMKEIFIRSNYDPNNKTLLSLQNIPYSNFDEYDITVKFADGTQYYKGEVTYN